VDLGAGHLLGEREAAAHSAIAVSWGEKGGPLPFCTAYSGGGGKVAIVPGWDGPLFRAWGVGGQEWPPRSMVARAEAGAGGGCWATEASYI